MSGDIGPEAFDRAQAARMAEGLREFLEPWLAKREKTILKRVFHLLDAGKPLPPEVAVQAWLELREAYRVDGELGKVIRQGRTAATDPGDESGD